MQHEERADRPDRVRSRLANASKALVAIVNSRVRGTAPTPEQLLSLIALAVVAPAQHGTSTFWGVVQPQGAKAMPENIKLSVFGGALQYVIEDLLANDTKVRCC